MKTYRKGLLCFFKQSNPSSINCIFELDMLYFCRIVQHKVSKLLGCYTEMRDKMQKTQTATSHKYNKPKQLKDYRAFWTFLFISYVFFLFIFVIIKFDGNINHLLDRVNTIAMSRESNYCNYNLEPFRTMRAYLNNLSSEIAFINVFGNIVAYMPMGFFIPLIFIKCKTFIKTIFLCCLAVIAIESFQFVSMLGYFDIDDIILNILGCCFGYAVLLICSWLIDRLNL